MFNWRQRRRLRLSRQCESDGVEVKKKKIERFENECMGKDSR